MLHPQARALLELIESRDIPPTHLLPAAEARAGYRDRRFFLQPDPPAVAEAREIIKEVESQCAEILVQNRHALERLTAQLLEHETVGGDVVDECLHAARSEQPLAA